MASVFAVVFGIALAVVLALYWQNRAKWKHSEQDSRDMRQKLDVAEQENRNLLTYKGKYEQLQESEQSLEKRFESIARKTFDQAGKELEERSKKSLGNTVEPLQKHLKDLTESMHKINREASVERNRLENLIGDTLKETNALTHALSTSSKDRGSMGEVALEQLLENLGLRKGEHYEVQMQVRDDEGKALRPDIVISLPDKRRVIIDAKFPLTHWKEYANASKAGDDAAAAQAMSQHVKAIKVQVDEMARRDYPGQVKDTLDFTLMFFFLDASVYSAFEADSQLFQYAWERKVGIISPITLLPTVRIIHNLWKMDEQRGSQKKILDLGKKMLDKFGGLLDSHNDLGRRLQTTQKAYDELDNRLTSGRGSLHSQMDKMQTLGVEGKRALPQADYDAEDTAPEAPNTSAGDPALSEPKAE